MINYFGFPIQLTKAQTKPEGTRQHTWASGGRRRRGHSDGNANTTASAVFSTSTSSTTSTAREKHLKNHF